MSTKRNPTTRQVKLGIQRFTIWLEALSVWSKELIKIRDWLRTKLQNGPAHINVQEIEDKAADWGLTPLEATLTFRDLRGDLWEGEFITVDEHPAGYAGAWVERVR
jgi:hypothetical protein